MVDLGPHIPHPGDSIATSTSEFRTTGLTCGHCAHAVTDELTDDGVAVTIGGTGGTGGEGHGIHGRRRPEGDPGAATEDSTRRRS